MDDDDEPGAKRRRRSVVVAAAAPAENERDGAECFGALPREILACVLSELTVADECALLRTCKFLRARGDTPQMWLERVRKAYVEAVGDVLAPVQLRDDCEALRGCAALCCDDAKQHVADVMSRVVSAHGREPFTVAARCKPVLHVGPFARLRSAVRVRFAALHVEPGTPMSVRMPNAVALLLMLGEMEQSPCAWAAVEDRSWQMREIIDKALFDVVRNQQWLRMRFAAFLEEMCARLREATPPDDDAANAACWFTV